MAIVYPFRGRTLRKPESRGWLFERPREKWRKMPRANLQGEDEERREEKVALECARRKTIVVEDANGVRKDNVWMSSPWFHLECCVALDLGDVFG